MKMSKLYKFILAVVVVVTTVSCDDYLTISPDNSLTKAEFWKTKADATSSIVGVYATLRTNQEYFLYWGEVRGDMLKSNAGKGAGVDKEAFDVFIVNPSNSMTKYTTMYSVINGANQVLKFVPGIVDIDKSFTQTDCNQILGEAYFLRAYSYFWLARTFKEVPLTLVPSENDVQDYNLKKSTQQELFEQIYSDVKLAEQYLPRIYSTLSQTKGRATRYAAFALEADLDLWMGNYQEAIYACDSVTHSKQYSLLTTSALGNLYYPGNTVESIWEFQYLNSLNQKHSLRSWFNSSVYFSATLTDDLFESKDSRKALAVSNSYNVMKYNVTTDDAHWMLYRLADIVLMKAEALAHLDSNDNATNIAAAVVELNKLRSRANIELLPGLSNTTAVDEAVLDERGRELCYEGKRWFDLVRIASRNNNANKTMLTSRVLSSFDGVEQQVINLRIYNPESWYLPLNSDAINNNTLLIQNPYYK